MNVKPKPKYSKDNMPIGSTSSPADTKPHVICGCRVSLTHFDAEDGYPVHREGVVVADLEQWFFKPNVNVKLDDGQTVYDYPKRCCVVLGNHI